MLSTVVYWLTTVPLGEPWRAIIIVGEVVVFAFALHWLWQFGFVLAGGIRRATSRARLRSLRDVSASRPDVAVAVNPAGESRLKPTSKVAASPPGWMKQPRPSRCAGASGI